MSAVEVEPGLDGARLDGARPDLVTARLNSMLVELESLVGDCTPVCEAVRVDRISRLERLRAAVAAVQAAELVRLGQARVAAGLAKTDGGREVDPAVADLAPEPESLDSVTGARIDSGQAGTGFDPARIGAGLIDEIGLACKLSPNQAGQRLQVARALWFDLPETFAALTAGGLSEHLASIIVRETRHLDHDQRRDVDTQLAETGITNLGWRAAEALAKRFAYQQDRPGYLDRSTAARKDRAVTLRPAPDGMAFLTGLLPLEQGVSCVAALRTVADSTKAGGDQRSRGQIMADTLVERLTGQTQATDVNVDVQILLPAELLIDPDSTRTATVQGFGPLPGGVATELIDASQGRKTWRTVRTGRPVPAGDGADPDSDSIAPGADQGWTSEKGSHADEAEFSPETGRPNQTEGPNQTGRQASRAPIVQIDPRRRFTGSLAALIKARDQQCRVPFCGAPIRHLDHIHRHRDGGPTTLENGQGLCARHNLVRETQGWHTDLIDSGVKGMPHTVDYTMPTGHTYRSQATDPP